MNSRVVREIIAYHADQLNSSHRRTPAALTRNTQVQGLLDLAEQLHGILVAVEPEANFRRRLGGELILEAQRRQAQARQEEPEANVFQQHRKGILIGAAAVGSVASLVGVVIAFILRYRHGRATHIAAS
jgi:hypothetical protein